jgi:hypothetical protein
LAGLVGALVATPVAVYASHQFGDVPNSNPFHDDIDWLADAEVTLGCGPNVYCPKDFVTREQMAAFMHRLGTNQVVDAGEVEGSRADQLLRVAHAETNDADDIEGTLLSASITAPSDGFLVISGGVTPTGIRDDGSVLTCGFNVDGQEIAASERSDDHEIEQSSIWGFCESSVTVPVDAGDHTVDLYFQTVEQFPTPGPASLTALFVPFDGTGDTP